MQERENLHWGELVELVLNRGGSVRLRNTLRAAQIGGDLEGLSIQSITANDPHAINKLLRLPHFGKTTLAELRSIVSLPSEPEPPDALLEPAHPETDRDLQSPNTSEHEFVTLAFSRGGSLRLRNSLLKAQRDGVLKGLSIRSITSHNPDATDRLMRVPNFGERCLEELQTILSLACEPKLPDLQADPERTVRQYSLPSIVRELPISSAIEALNYLDEKAKQVIQARLGLDGTEPLSLASVGEVLGLTRERIRQIETKALERLETMFGQTFTQMRTLNQSAALSNWAIHQVIPDRDEGDLFNSLSPEMRLLVKVKFKSIRRWLDTVCKTVPNGWLLPSISIEAYQQAKYWISIELESIKLPCPLSYLLGPSAPPKEAILAALRLSEGIKLVDGYLLPKGSTRRARRAARLHEIMLHQQFAQSIGLVELKDAYRKIYFDDQCSARDLLVVLFDNTHLFLNQYELGWLPIGLPIDSIDLPSEGQTQEHELVVLAAEDDENPEEESETLRGTLAQILLEYGPQSFNDLRRIFVKKVGDKYSKASVGPILISTDEFARIGPGIYAHRRQLHDKALLDDASNRLLLNKSQCETYCRALWAGEDPYTYILWTPDMQFCWAEWCFQTEQKELLSSLLAVSNVEQWPVKGGDRARWVRLQDRLRMYLLEESPTSLIDRLPTFREFLSGAAFATNFGRVSWIGLNRVTGYRVDDRHSVSLLALLIAVGIVEPAIHWQQQHHTTEIARDVLRSLLAHSKRDGETQWPKAVVRSMRKNYELLFESGWTTSDSMQTFFDALSQNGIRDEYAEPYTIPEVDEYEQLKRQLKNELMLDSLRKRIADGNPEFNKN